MVYDKLITNFAKTEGLKLHREDLDNHVIPEVCHVQQGKTLAW